MTDLAYKITIFGNSSVGKTTFTTKYITGLFQEDIKITLGIDIRVKYLKIKNYDVTLQIWDFGGEDRFRYLFRHYARGASGGIFMYDITNEASLKALEEWIIDFRENITKEEKYVPIIVVGAKLDLQGNREVSIERAMKFSKPYDIFQVMECSSKTGDNVEEIFEVLTHKIMDIYGYLS